jgi:SAM-dependent methyltransferase
LAKKGTVVRKKSIRPAACRLCRSAKAEFLLSANQPKLGVLRIVKCPDCGLIYVHPQPFRAQLDKIYSEDYFLPSSEQLGYASYFSGNAAAAYEKGKALAGRLAARRGAGRALEIGCATGHFLQGFKENSGWDVQGVEISRWAADYARTHFNLRVFNGTLQEAAYPDESCDVICLSDVLEHVLDPVGFLKEARRILRKDGKIYAGVPRAGSELLPFLRAWEKESLKIMRPAHLFFFTPGSIKKLFEKAGLEITALHYAALRSGLRDRGMMFNRLTFYRGPGLWPKAANSSLRKILYWVCDRLSFGHELEIIAQRRR